MNLFSTAARCALGFGAAVTVAACASQPQLGALPQTAIAPAAAGAVSTQAASPSSSSYKFITINNMKDPTFNQLLGINASGVISGYFGSGLTGHPNKGYTVMRPYKQGNFKNENYPGSVQTQVTAINNVNDTAGFWVDGNNVNRGFIRWNDVFTSYTDPNIGSGTVTQILGLNDSGRAVGFYTDGNGANHGFSLNQATGKFTDITPPGASNVSATAINDAGTITGFYTQGKKTIGWIKRGSSFSTFHFPNSKVTMPFGINNRLDIVGAYIDGKGATHGFLLTNPLQNATWTSIDDPNGIGTTTINGLNDKGDMVGFYVDTTGNTDGMLVKP